MKTLKITLFFTLMSAGLFAQHGYNPMSPMPYQPKEKEAKSSKYIQPEVYMAILVTRTASSFTLYPNPAKDYVELHWDGFAEGLKDALVINIYNNTGTLLQRHNIEDYMKNVWMLRTDALNNGLYIVELNDSNGSTIYTQKLTIVK